MLDFVCSTSIVFDPAHPVPTIGGNNLQLPCGPLDNQMVTRNRATSLLTGVVRPQIEQAHRADVLTYTSDVLQDSMAITGEISMFFLSQWLRCIAVQAQSSP